MYFKTKMNHNGTPLNIVVHKKYEKHIISRLESNKKPLVFKRLFINKSLVTNIKDCVKHNKTKSSPGKVGKLLYDNLNYNLSDCKILTIRGKVANNIRKSYSITISYKKASKNK
jgi:hypothetical protein